MTLPATFVQGFHDEDSVRKMEYRRLGKTNLLISKLALGGATFAALYGKLNEEEAILAIQSAIKSGINYIDTAPFYGQGRSEQVLGRALKDVPRQAYYIATKVGRYDFDLEHSFDFTAKRVVEGFKNSLNLLGLDYVDIIQIHDVEFADNLDIVISETLPTVKEFVKNGQAKFVGITGYPLNVLKEAIERAPANSFDVVLSYARYNLLDQTLLEYIPFFQKRDLGIVCASGVALGLLTNNGPQPWHPANEETKELCRQAAEYCKNNDVNFAKIAVYFFVQLSEPATFLLGMQTKALVDANLDACLNELSKKESEVLLYLQKNFFKSSTHWEGVEVGDYRAKKLNNK